MEIFVCKFNMLKKCKIKTKKNKKGNKKKQGEKPKKQAKKQNTQKCILLFFNSNQYDTASYARVYQTRAEVSRPPIIITKEVRYEK